jgi:hypothetical protein
MANYAAIFFDPLAFDLLEAAVPQIKVVDFGTQIRTVLAFDDTAEEYASGCFECPQNIDTSASVTFRAHLTAATGAASKNIAMTFAHRAVDDAEAIDGAYTDEDSGDKAIDATTSDLTTIEWTETVSNLGWAAEDFIQFRLSRDPGAGTDLVGDLYLLGFTIEIPLA